MSEQREVVILSGVRTAIGDYGSALKDIAPTELAAKVAREAVARARIDPGEVGVRRAFGYVDPQPLLSGIRFVVPWSEIERYSTREEQWPPRGEQTETIEALSSEQMGMRVDVSIRWPFATVPTHVAMPEPASTQT